MIIRLTPARVDSMYRLTLGKIYKGKYIEGIFQDKPFAEFNEDDNNTKTSIAHLSRFKILTKCKSCKSELIQNVYTGCIQCTKCGKELQCLKV